MNISMFNSYFSSKYIYINTIELFCFETSIFLDNETDKRNFSKN